MQPAPPTKAQQEQLYLLGVEAPYAFKKANVVLLHVPDSANVAFRKMARAFLSAGFGLDKTAPDLLFISTSPQPHKTGVTVTARATIEPEAQGTIIRLQGVSTWAAGEVVMRGAGQLLSPITCHGMQGSPARAAWDMLEAAAAAYPGAKLGYLCKP